MLWHILVSPRAGRLAHIVAHIELDTAAASPCMHVLAKCHISQLAEGVAHIVAHIEIDIGIISSCV